MNIETAEIVNEAIQTASEGAQAPGKAQRARKKKAEGGEAKAPRARKKKTEAEAIAHGYEAKPGAKGGAKGGALGALARKAPEVVHEGDYETLKFQLKRLSNEYDDLTLSAKRTRQRCGDIHREEGTVIKSPYSAEQKNRSLEISRALVDARKKIEREMLLVLRQMPIYARFLSHVRGVGVNTAGKILAYMNFHDVPETPERPAHALKLSNFLRRAGIACVVGEDGKAHADRPRAGQKLSYAKPVKVALYQSWQSMVKDAGRERNPYYICGRDYKHRLLTSPRYDPETNTFDGRKGGKMIVDQRTYRPAMQLLMEHVYIVGRCFFGLPFWPSYEAARVGYLHGGRPVDRKPIAMTFEEALDFVGTPALIKAAKIVPAPRTEPDDDLEDVGVSE